MATLKCISAFSGRCLTNSESETIVNQPVRRRILIILMLFGNLDCVTARFTEFFIDAEQTTSAILILMWTVRLRLLAC